MPTFASIVVNDRATTPVSHTFVPRVKEPVATYVETTGVPIGERKFTLSMRKVGSKFKGRLVLTNPVVVNETINGVVSPKVVRTAYAALELTFDEMSSTQERKDTVGMLANALAASVTQVNSVLVDLEGIF